ncbi:MAG: YcnI family protein [Chloroflexi bacterium]|nr:YcnI family protein [Chloroflexota bacterium]
MTSHRSRRLMGATLGAALLLTLAVPASAHVSIIDGSAVVGGGHGTQITFRVPHGCAGAPTDTIEVLIPEGVTSVQPKWMAGWTIETEPRATAGTPTPEGTTGPDSHGEATTEVGLVRWTGGPLPDSMYLDFQVRAVFPETPGTIHFPIVQYCGDAEEAWIQIPAEGQSPDDLEMPAPSVTIVAGEAEDH